MTFTQWLAQLRSQFPLPEEYEIACKAYPFASAFELGMSPVEAYAAFDRLVCAFEREAA